MRRSTTGRAARNASSITPQLVPCTDLGNAERLVTRHGDDMRYSETHGWLVWTGSRWMRDDNGQVQRWAFETARAIYAEAFAAEQPARRKELAQWAKQTESAHRIKAMITL